IYVILRDAFLVDDPSTFHPGGYDNFSVIHSTHPELEPVQRFEPIPACAGSMC
ncbi:6000_t:CDS:2, partial [Ambispora leptoticha]